MTEQLDDRKDQITQWAQQGWSQIKIANELNVSIKRFRKWLQAVGLKTQTISQCDPHRAQIGPILRSVSQGATLGYSDWKLTNNTLIFSLSVRN